MTVINPLKTLCWVFLPALTRIHATTTRHNVIQRDKPPSNRVTVAATPATGNDFPANRNFVDDKAHKPPRANAGGLLFWRIFADVPTLFSLVFFRLLQLHPMLSPTHFLWV